MSRLWLIVLGLVALIVVVGCVWLFFFSSSHAGDRTKLERTFTAAEQQLIDSNRISKEELAAKDGKDGHPAWVCINQVVYDITDHPAWKHGRHHGLEAGADLTERFVQSGHGLSVLQKMTVVGSMAEP